MKMIVTAVLQCATFKIVKEEELCLRFRFEVS